jgi:hypothetical protein
MPKCPHCGFEYSLARPRTVGPRSQNHHLRGHARQIADYTGHSMSEIMQIIKEETSSWPTHSLHGHTVWASEADITADVAAEAIERTHVIAVDLGVALEEG